MIEFPPYRLDARAERLWRGNHPVALRPKAWALLRYLVERPGTLVTKDELHAAVWGDAVVSDDTLTRTLARAPAGAARRRPDAAHHRDRAPAGVSLHRPDP